MRLTLSAMHDAGVWIACIGLATCSLQPTRAEPGIGRPGPPLDVAQCRAAWKAASPNREPIPAAAAKLYLFDFEAMDVDQDGKISEYEFKDGCMGGWVREVPDATAKTDQVTVQERGPSASCGRDRA